MIVLVEIFVLAHKVGDRVSRTSNVNKVAGSRQQPRLDPQAASEDEDDI